MTVIEAQTAAEREAAYLIRRNVFIEEQHIDPELEWDEHDRANDARVFIYYSPDGTALATGRFRILPAYGKVERVCTQKAARGQGSGRKIMEAIEGVALANNITQLKLGAQITAIPFYEKLGYHVCSGDYLDAGILHKEMKKELK